jgi:hypothetical protein
VTGGPVIVTQLEHEDAVVLMPVGTTPPPGVVAIDVADLALPPLLLWPAGLPSAAVHRVRERMAPPGSRSAR